MLFTSHFFFSKKRLVLSEPDKLRDFFFVIAKKTNWPSKLFSKHLNMFLFWFWFVIVSISHKMLKSILFCTNSCELSSICIEPSYGQSNSACFIVKYIKNWIQLEIFRWIRCVYCLKCNFFLLSGLVLPNIHVFKLEWIITLNRSLLIIRR